MTKFRGCIDIHSGQVKQIVGGTLDTKQLDTNFVSTKPSSYYAKLYRDNGVTGTHIIKLGSSAENDAAALEALRAWPGAMQIGGGINIDNCQYWLENGASHVIITSWLFTDNEFDWDKLAALERKIGKHRIVIDLSCRVVGDSWFVCMNKWQTITNLELNCDNLVKLSHHCDEFLVHAADVEGLCKGVDMKLVEKLGQWGQLVDTKITYAGGANSLNDLHTVDEKSNGKVDLTFGSALDIFGGKLVKFADLVEYNRLH